jgi:hypothetical protein
LNFVEKSVEIRCDDWVRETLKRLLLAAVGPSCMTAIYMGREMVAIKIMEIVIMDLQSRLAPGGKGAC